MNEADAAPNILAVLINWLPTIVIAAIWLFYFRRTIALQKEAIEEMHKSAVAMERVAEALERRS